MSLQTLLAPSWHHPGGHRIGAGVLGYGTSQSSHRFDFWGGLPAWLTSLCLCSLDSKTREACFPFPTTGAQTGGNASHTVGECTPGRTVLPLQAPASPDTSTAPSRGLRKKGCSSFTVKEPRFGEDSKMYNYHQASHLAGQGSHCAFPTFRTHRAACKPVLTSDACPVGYWVCKGGADHRHCCPPQQQQQQQQQQQSRKEGGGSRSPTAAPPHSSSRGH